MTLEEAIKTLETNYPDACFEQLREAVDAAIEALKAQDAAGDTISRAAAIEAMDGFNACGYVEEPFERLEKALKEIPSAQPERKTGRWIPVMNGRGGHCCNRCNGYAPSYMNGDEHLSDFCPNCGAYMGGDN